MRNVMKAATLESRFPLMAVEHGCIISKDADITVAYRVELPEVFTLTRAEYEALHSTWAKAVRVLPNYSIVHKQDIFIEESYRPDICRDDLSFLSRSFERHFNERSLPITRWQGANIDMEFAPLALATARTALDIPIRWAISP